MILVAVGTGRLGTLVVQRLRTRHLRVRVLTRDRPRAAHLEGLGVEVLVGDVGDERSLELAMAGVDTVVSAVHGFGDVGRVSPASVDRDGNRHLVDAAAAARADVVLMSIVGASADHPLELFRIKYAAEAHLRTSGAAWTIVRATAFAEFWLDLLDQTAAGSGRPVIFGRGANPINFVSVSDVAAVVEQAFIGADNKVKLTPTYPASTGRNVQEILRAPDSSQFTANHAVSTPADWQPGDDVIIPPAVSDEDATKRFPGGFVTKTPYLRVTPQPGRDPQARGPHGLGF